MFGVFFIRAGKQSGSVRPAWVQPPVLAAAALLIIANLACSLLTGTPSNTLYVTPAGNDTNDCLSVAHPCRHIAAAITKAHPDDTINIAAGTYAENLSVSKSLWLIGAAADTTVIDGSLSGYGVQVAPATHGLLSGVTIRNGRGAEAGGFYLAASASMLLVNVNVQSSQSNHYGGGISNFGELRLVQVHVNGNQAPAQCGGVYNAGTMSIGGGDIFFNSAPTRGSGVCNALGASMTIDRSRIHENINGGGILNQGTLRLTNSSVFGNQSATDGAGIYNMGNLDIRGGEIGSITPTLANGAQGSGGGIYSLGPLTIANATIDNNAAIAQGGGIYAACSTTLTAGTVNGNHASVGGGIYLASASCAGGPASLIMTNSTISGNGGVTAGGLYLASAYEMIADTIAFNTGEGVLATVDESASFGLSAYTGTIISNNSAANCSGPVGSAAYSLSSDSTCTWVTGSGGGFPNLIGVDPQLQTLADNGGPTWTHALGRDTAGFNPAIDYWVTGLFSSLPGLPSPPSCPYKDQRGVARPIDGNGDGIVWCDIGAYEDNLRSTHSPIVAATPGPSPTSDIILLPPTETPTPFVGLTLILTKNANCRRGPGTVFESVDAYPAGQTLLVDGRSEIAPLWWQVQLPTNAKKHCFISSAAGQPNGDPNLLLIIISPPTPTPTHEPAAIDFDKDGYPAGPDCNDKNGKIHPGAGETPKDGVDSNCNGDDNK